MVRARYDARNGLPNIRGNSVFACKGFLDLHGAPSFVRDGLSDLWRGQNAPLGYNGLLGSRGRKLVAEYSVP